MLEWLAMGGYALYVWGSFGMTAACMLLEPWWVQRQEKVVRAQIARRFRVESTS